MNHTTHCTAQATGFWRTRFTVLSLCALATFICYVDRVNISIAIIPMAREYSWDTETQGLILSSFFIGYMLMQIVGGWLADRFGGKAVLGIGVLWWSLFTLLTPPAAALGLTALLLTRILMGAGEAVAMPSVYSIIARWMPLTERSRAIALNTSFYSLGTIFSILITPLIVSNLGWQWAFYLFSILGFVWWLFWHKLVTSEPAQHPRVTADELAEINANQAQSPQTASAAPTILALLKHRSVWAIIIAHFCFNWSFYVLLSWLPTYVNQGLKVDFAAIGIFTMLPHICLFIGMNMAGRIADNMIAGGTCTTRVRKIMQALGFGGPAIAFMVVGYVDTAVAAIAIMCIGVSFGAFSAGGFLVNHMDIAPRHAGKMMGITNTAGTIPGIIGVYFTGLILQLTGSWVMVFQLTAAITIAGLVFYLTFASSKKIYH